MTESTPTLTPNAPAPQPKTPAISVWSLVLGILSIFCLWILGSIPAIILGIVGIKKANENPQEVGGKGLALAGIITGSVGILTGIATMGMYAAMVMPAVAGVQAQAEKTVVMNDMRQVSFALQAYTLDHEMKYPASLADLVPDYLETDEFIMQVNDVSGESALFLYRPPAATTEDFSNTVLLLSPFPIQGERVVAYADGRVETIPEPLDSDLEEGFE